MNPIVLTFFFKAISKSNEKFMGRNRRFFLSPKFREFENKIKMFARMQYKGAVIHTPLSVTITANFNDKRHCDATNLFKGICDALQGLIYENDKQIKEAMITVYEDKRKLDMFKITIEDFIE